MLKRLITHHPLVTLLVMMVSVLIFGLSTYNLFAFYKANVTYIAENGWMGVIDGGGEQFLLLTLNGAVGIVFYIIFKACEKALVDKILK